MKPEVRKYLYDMLLAIRELAEISKAFANDFNNYKNNLTGKRAVERELEIIGEALNKALKEDPFLQIENQEKIISLRNYLIHNYDNVQDEILWGIIMKHIPILREDLETKLAN